jgi:Ca-activated chloride channel family protein
MIRFAHPEYFTLLFVLIPLAAAFILFWFRMRRRSRLYAESALLDRLVEQRSRVKPILRAAVLMLAIALFITALAGPQVGSKYEEVQRAGIDLVVAIDVSSSMLAQDIKPDRITAAKRELMNLIDNLKGDRIGIIVFSGEAYTQLPLTTDYGAAVMMTDIISVGMTPRPGTAMGAAINMARESFAKEEGKYRAMVLITDGENHEDDAVESAKEAASENIIIHCIGMGLPEGAPVPLEQDGEARGFKKDNEGNPVLSKLDEESLKAIANATGGTYTRAENGRDNLAQVFKEIEKMEKREIETKRFTEYEDRFQVPLALGFLLLIMEALMSEKRNRFLARFSIFRGSEAS